MDDEQRMQELDELYGYFSEAQMAEHLAAVRQEADTHARQVFALMAETYRRQGRIPDDLEPELWARWTAMGLDLTLVGR